MGKDENGLRIEVDNKRNTDFGLIVKQEVVRKLRDWLLVEHHDEKRD